MSSEGPGAGIPRPRGRTLAFLAVSVFVFELVVAAAVFDPSPHTGGDNAGYVTLAVSLLERGAYLNLHDPAEPIHIKYPPVYPAVLAAAIALGARTWTALKALSAVFMALAVLGVFLWVERRRGVAMALTVAVLVAACEAFLFHTRWILSDPLFLGLTLTSLWAFGAYDSVPAEGPSSSEAGGTPWLAVACGTAILAFFTRSAGLPLVVALVGVLALRRRWWPLLAYGLAFAVPAVAWWLRSRGSEAYVAEFWLVDPYQPELGRIAASDLGLRVWENGRAYWGRWIPGGLIGLRGDLVAGAGGALGVLAAAGWWNRLRWRVGAAELFTPLYLGLILLWPQVWAGDRFALPLYPLLLFYAGETLLDLIEGLKPWLRAVAVALAIAPFAVPALALVWVGAGEARNCRAAVAAEGVFACYGAAVREYVKAAEWSGANLPPDAWVMTRKPRLFYLLTGRKSRTYPLTRDPALFLEEAVAGNMTHVVMDYLDSLGAFYVAPVIQERAGAFCSLVGFGAPGATRTEIFGILPPGEWEAAGPARADGTEAIVSVRVCAGSPPGGTAPMEPPYGSPEIPLLVGLRPQPASP